MHRSSEKTIHRAGLQSVATTLRGRTDPSRRPRTFVGWIVEPWPPPPPVETSNGPSKHRQDGPLRRHVTTRMVRGPCRDHRDRRSLVWPHASACAGANVVNSRGPSDPISGPERCLAGGPRTIATRATTTGMQPGRFSKPGRSVTMYRLRPLKTHSTGCPDPRTGMRTGAMVRSTTRNSPGSSSPPHWPGRLTPGRSATAPPAPRRGCTGQGSGRGWLVARGSGGPDRFPRDLRPGSRDMEGASGSRGGRSRQVCSGDRDRGPLAEFSRPSYHSRRLGRSARDGTRPPAPSPERREGPGTPLRRAG